MQAAIALVVLLGLAGGADAVMTAAPAKRSVPSATASMTDVTPGVGNEVTPGPRSDADDFTVSPGPSGTTTAADGDETDATVPGDPPSTSSRSSRRYLHGYIHYDMGIGTAWPRGTTKPRCTKWTKVGDTYNRWTQDVYTATVTTTLTRRCGGCAVVWTTPHHGYAWAKVFETSTAAEPFTVTEVACEGPEGKGYLRPPHTPTDPRSTHTVTQTYPSTLFVTYPDHGPSTVTPPGIPSPTCTRYTIVGGGGGYKVYKQVVYPYSTVKTVTKDCGTCALAWSTKFFWHYTRGEIIHFYTMTHQIHIATKLECGPAVPTSAFDQDLLLDPESTTATSAPTAASTTTLPY